MGVDTVSTPAGKQDRPFANPGILRGFWRSILSLPLLSEQDIDPVRRLLPVRLPVMGVPVTLPRKFLDLGGGVSHYVEPTERPLVLGTEPDLAGHGGREREGTECPNLAREFFLQVEIFAGAVPDLFEFHGHHDRVAVHQAVKGQ